MASDENKTFQTEHLDQASDQKQHGGWIDAGILRFHELKDEAKLAMWRHRGGACPGGLEVSRGIVEANCMTLWHIRVPSVDLTHPNSCQLMSDRSSTSVLVSLHLVS